MKRACLISTHWAQGSQELLCPLPQVNNDGPRCVCETRPRRPDPGLLGLAPCFVCRQEQGSCPRQGPLQGERQCPRSRARRSFRRCRALTGAQLQNLQEAVPFFNRGQTPAGCQQDLESITLWGEGL